MNLNENMSGDRLSTRLVSGFPLSLPTGLSVEAIFEPTMAVYDPLRIPPNKINLANYNECWFNVATLFRNMVGVVQKETFVKTHQEEFADTILSEMDVINGLFQNEGMGMCRPVYYYTVHDKLKKSAPVQIKFREPNTDNQRAYQFKLDKTLEKLTKATEALLKFDTEIRPTSPSKALIMTHIPYDLLSHRNFAKLSLLESHTGKVKNYNQWYTKYYPVGESDLSHVPFLKRLLLVFGDNVLIQPSVYKLRQQIVEIAQKRNWTAATTDAKVLMDLSLEIKEPYVLAFLKSL